MSDAERLSDVSHHLCGIIGGCNCPADNPEGGQCWQMAARILKLPDLDREELARAIAPVLQQQAGQK